MIPLLSQQIKAKDKLWKWKCGALFMKPGTCKTRIAIELVNRIPDVDLIVWIGPKSSIFPKKKNITSIIDEINKWGNFHCENVIYIGVETISLSDSKYLNLYNAVKNSKKSFIVVDESLKIKNIDTKRTQRVIKLGTLTEYKLILNGTPFSKNLEDIYPQMYFLSPKILNMTALDFKNTFIKYTTITYTSKYYNKSHTEERITGYANIDYLYSLIHHYIYECDLQLNISQLWNVYHYRIDKESKDFYNELKERYLNSEMMKIKNNNIFLEMTQKMQHSYSCTKNKLEILDEHFNKYPQKEHIIFCKYIDSRNLCEKYYPKATVLSYQSESFSLNLQHLPYTIFFDKTWDYAVREQGSNRNFRTGALKDISYWDLTGDVGLENLIDSCIAKKINMLEYLKKISADNLKTIL